MGISQNKKYAFSTYLHPQQDFRYSIEHFWGTELVFYDIDDKSKEESEKLMKYLASDEARRLLSASSVSYFPIFIEDEASYQSIRRDLGKDRPYFEKQIDNISYLRKIDLGMKKIILYKTTGYKPHIYLTNEEETLRKDVQYKKLNFQMISPSEYHILFQNISKPVYLNFTELNDLSWKIHIGNFNWWEVLYKKDYFLSDSIHSQNAIRFNQFYLDPKEICLHREASAKRCKVESDGSYSFEATLYAKPQSYFYLGLILSGASLIIVFCSLPILLRKEKNAK
jgi:hypothetical protein